MDRAARPAVRALLAELLSASESLGEAVIRHDHDGIVAAVGRCEKTLDDMSQAAKAAASAAPDQPRDARPRPADPEILALRESIRSSARRNAYLIERAWSVDADTLRLIAGLGRQATTEGPARAYAAAGGPNYLDTPA